MQEAKYEAPAAWEDELKNFTVEDSAFLASEPSEPSSAGPIGIEDKPRYRTQDKL